MIAQVPVLVFVDTRLLRSPLVAQTLANLRRDLIPLPPVALLLRTDQFTIPLGLDKELSEELFEL